MVNILLSVIIILLMVIAVWAFYIGKNLGNQNSNGSTAGVNNNSSEITVKLISDERCTNCFTGELEANLKKIPALANVNFEKMDFADKDVSEYLLENDIKALPAVIFNRSYIDQAINTYLQPLKSGEYTLNIGAEFDPFAKRSERGFLTIDVADIAKVKESSYIKGSEDAKITWLEYSDLECPFCAKLHNSPTPKEVMEKYEWTVNKIFNHFPLNFHANAQKAAETLECAAQLNGSEVYYNLISKSFEKYNNNNFVLTGLYDLAAKMWVNKSKLIECVDSGKYADKVVNQMQFGQAKFNVTGTPGNVLVNNTTGEYIVLSWAVGTQAFTTAIESLK